MPAINGAVSLSNVTQRPVRAGHAGRRAEPRSARWPRGHDGAMQNGVLLYAKRVESAGHVEAAICNFSGTTMTPITDLPVRVVTFG